MAPIPTDLPTTVQHNCHIADARFAGEYTVCIYLMKMREFFRWENRLAFADTLPRETVGNWLRQREQLWESVEADEFRPLRIDGIDYEAFDVQAINARLNDRGWVYGAGLGYSAAPHFFLAELEQKHQVDDCTIYVAGREVARDLTSPPAVSQGREIFIRRESLKRSMWERLESWNWNRPQNAMARALASFDVEGDVERALDEMTEMEVDSVLHHEFGEIEAGKLLGEGWHEMLISLPRSRVEFMARAVRDLLADSLSTLPHLLEQGEPASLHFYIANLVGMRKELAPGLFTAYQHWIEHNDLEPLHAVAESGKHHWLTTADRMLELFQQRGPKSLASMKDLLEQSRL